MCVSLFVSQNFFQLMLIQGDSMEPTYKNIQLVIIDKKPDNLKQGDVIAFYSDLLESVLVKRIVACPGDSVQILDGNIYINKAIYDINNLYKGNVIFAGIAENEIILSDNEFFVLGDNVEKSKDSRYAEVGCISKINILGRVIP